MYCISHIYISLFALGISAYSLIASDRTIKPDIIDQDFVRNYEQVHDKLSTQSINPADAVLFFIANDHYINTDAFTICAKLFASQHPYACYDIMVAKCGSGAFSIPLKKRDALIESFLDYGFMMPYMEIESQNIDLPVLHALVTCSHNNKPNFSLVKRILDLGANPHCLVHTHPDGSCYMDAFNFIDRAHYTQKDKQKLRALLQRYERTSTNITDLFHPGTRFYRKDLSPLAGAN